MLFSSDYNVQSFDELYNIYNKFFDEYKDNKFFIEFIVQFDGGYTSIMFDYDDFTYLMQTIVDSDEINFGNVLNIKSTSYNELFEKLYDLIDIDNA